MSRLVQVGDQLGEYRLVREIGRGAFGTVYLGEHQLLWLQVAIKILHTVTPQAHAALLAEWRRIANLRHRHIITVLGFSTYQNQSYLVLQYVPNDSLKERYPLGQSFPIETILPHVQQIAEGVQFAHDHQLLHLNLKPANILLDERDEVLVSDFGMTRTLHSHTTGETLAGFAGTPAYAAPEQFQERPECASDQYALATMVYQWLTGRLPFTGDLMAIIGQKFMGHAPPSLGSEVAPAVAAVVLRGLAEDPGDRFPSVAAFAKELARVSKPPPAPVPVIAPGGRLGSYLLNRFLGQGHSAEVWLGEHVHGRWQRAIKILHARLSAQEQVLFLREAQIIAPLEHRNIVSLMDYGVEGTIPFLVMNYAPDGSLHDRHPNGTPLALDVVVSYVKQVAAALQYAHDTHLIHRDVKPENMLVNRNGEVLLSDFGIAVKTPSQGADPQDAAGTIAYMAPEQFQGKADRASDQYALGVTVYEWLTGKRPFRGTAMEITGQHLNHAPQPLREIVPGIPLLVEWVVLKALEKDPKNRFGRVRAFAIALEQACRP
jgi:serine/threonine protein kinase